MFGHDVESRDAVNYKTAVKNDEAVDREDLLHTFVDHYNRIVKVTCHTTVLTIL